MTMSMRCSPPSSGFRHLLPQGEKAMSGMSGGNLRSEHTSAMIAFFPCGRRWRQPDEGFNTPPYHASPSAAQAAKDALIAPFFDDTQIFIYPGYQYQVIDALVTNFHLPESTLIMLVSAFAGYQHTMNAYKVAVEQKYRFFSYGDAMFITYNPQAISERP